MLYGITQIIAFLMVNGHNGIAKITVATRLHLHEYGGVTILRNNVNVTMLGMPVAFKDDIALLS